MSSSAPASEEPFAALFGVAYHVIPRFVGFSLHRRTLDGPSRLIETPLQGARWHAY